MADKLQSRLGIPWHLWAVGGVSLLWNAIGAVDFTMTQTHNEAYMGQFSPEQLEYFHGFPMWAVITWGAATWGSLIGSVLLLFRSRAAVTLFLVSIAGMVLTTIYNFVLSDGLKVMGSSVVPLLLSGLIWIVALLLYFYARAMRKRGVLR